MSQRLLVCAGEIHRKILAVKSAVPTLQFIEYVRIIDLGFVKPLQEAQIQDRSVNSQYMPARHKPGYLRLENGQVPVVTTHIIPSVVNLSLRLNGCKLVPCRLFNVTVGRRVIAGEVDGRRSKLIVNVAGEIPIQVASDGRVRSFRNVRLAVLIGVLEHEGYIRAGYVPIPF